MLIADARASSRYPCAEKYDSQIAKVNGEPADVIVLPCGCVFLIDSASCVND